MTNAYSQNSVSDSRPLSERAARRCETAKTPASACRCRCAGLYHGGQRADAAMLVDGDPHRFIPADENRKKRAKRARLIGGSSRAMTVAHAVRHIESLERAIANPGESDSFREAARVHIAGLQSRFPELRREVKP